MPTTGQASFMKCQKNLRYGYKIVEITDYEIIEVTLLQECCEN